MQVGIGLIAFWRRGEVGIETGLIGIETGLIGIGLDGIGGGGGVVDEIAAGVSGSLLPFSFALCGLMDGLEANAGGVCLFCPSLTRPHLLSSFGEFLQLFLQSLQIHAEFLDVKSGGTGVVVFVEGVLGIGNGDGLPLGSGCEMLDGALWLG